MPAVAAMHLKALPDPPNELESLFREHHELVFRAAYRVTGNPIDAEDALQTVFLRLARRKEGYDLQPSPASYLMRAAVNASLDLMRSRKRASSVALEDVESELVGDSNLNPEAQHADKELRQIVRESLARLGQRAAEVFVLRYFEGYGNREIAEMLGTSPLVVGVMLHRTRGRLRKEIGEYLEKYHEA